MVKSIKVFKLNKGRVQMNILLAEYNSEMEQAQLRYCEKYGIIDSQRIRNSMIYYSSYPSVSQDKAITYKVTVDLERFEEVERRQLKRYYKKGEVNRCL